METILPLPFLTDVTVPPGQEGLSADDVSCLGIVFLEVAPGHMDEAMRFLQRHGADYQVYMDGSCLHCNDDVVSLLDGGARKVFVRPQLLPGLAEFGARVAPSMSGNDAGLLESATEGGLLLLDFNHAQCKVEPFLDARRSRSAGPLFIRPVAGTGLDSFVDFARQCCAIPILPSTGLTTREEAGKLQVAKILSAAWTSDRPDGLLPTVVCDEGGVALGLVYSSEESVAETLRTHTGVYQSRKRGLWRKGASSGDTQELVRVALDCDKDALKFTVRQTGRFCHLEQPGCFGDVLGIPRLAQTLLSRKQSAPEGSYTARLFNDEKLLRAKIMEEAEELCEAKTAEDVAFEAADLIYFALAKVVASGVSLAQVERRLDAKAAKVTRRPGHAKGKWAEREGIETATDTKDNKLAGRISMKRHDASRLTEAELDAVLKRPSQKSFDAVMKIVLAIIEDVRKNGDRALLSYTHKFEKATSLDSAVIKAPFPESMMQLSAETKQAIDVSFDNIEKFHAAQKEDKTLQVETMPGVMCSRFSRPIEAVGLYVPGGTAVLPSTALMLGVPAMVAGCKRIVLASPPRADGTVSAAIVYIAHRVGAEAIVLAGGAQAVAAMAYGTESLPKVDKILGPGNQFVTAAKMHVSNDPNAAVAIDMPAGPSELLVVADSDANPAFVASDLLSQAEHGPDSQVVLVAVGLDEPGLGAIEDQLQLQAEALPRVDTVRASISHSVTVRVRDMDEAMRVSNRYAPEHLILQVREPDAAVAHVTNAGSVFVGEWTPESVGDYSAGVNHSLPTYGYAKQYSGVSLASFVKHVTSARLTAQGLRNVGGAVMQLAKVEELEAHRRAVVIRLEHMDRNGMGEMHG